VIFVNDDFGPFSELINFHFGLLFGFDEILNVFDELGFFIDKFKSFVIIVVDFFNHGLGVVINVFIVLSFGENLVFWMMM
jgi:hypothetical protein